MTARASLSLFSMTAATLSADRRYRYTLTRRWALSGETVAFIMLNPSTADETADDPTVRRCRGFAAAWGCGAVLVLNLFALRATDPGELWKPYAAPVGPDNDAEILAALEQHDVRLVVAAWGAWKAKRFREREREFLEAFPRPLYVLALTKDGHPRHPLYLRGTSRPTPWRSRT